MKNNELESEFYKKPRTYYHDLSQEQLICDEFYCLGELYDHETYNIANEDLPAIIEKLKGFVKAAPRYLEPYLWLEEIYLRNRRERSANAIFKKASAKALQMVLGKEKTWPNELPWGDLNNRTLIRILLRNAEQLWHRGQTDQQSLDQAMSIYLNLLNSNPYDQPCSRIFVLAILEGISNDEFYTKFMDYNDYGDYCLKNEVFIWFENNAPHYPELASWLK